MLSTVYRVHYDAERDSIVPVHVDGSDAVDEGHSSLDTRRERYGFVVPEPQKSHPAARGECSTNELQLAEVLMMVLLLHGTADSSRFTSYRPEWATFRPYRRRASCRLSEQA
jgi:hypothetical protein